MKRDVLRLACDVVLVVAFLACLASAAFGAGGGSDAQWLSGHFSYPNFQASWGGDNRSSDNVSTDLAHQSASAWFNLSTPYQVSGGSWSVFFNPAVEKGDQNNWHAEYYFNGKEVLGTVAEYQNNGATMEMGGQILSEYSYLSNYQKWPSEDVWNEVGGSFSFQPGRLTSSSLSLREYPDWGDPTVTDFYGIFSLYGEWYPGVVVPPSNGGGGVGYSATPEPGTWALLLTGSVAGIALLRKRRRA